MQIAVIEFARSVMKLHGANSTEFDPTTKTPCVVFMPEGSKTHMGATMRLGSRRTFFQATNCKSAKLYGNACYVDERHRHRYEVNPDMVPEFEKAGLSFVGRDESGERMEIIELPTHRFFVGAQFHPEFKSRPGKPSPLFLGKQDILKHVLVFCMFKSVFFASERSPLNFGTIHEHLGRIGSSVIRPA
ncbi:CTP synthase family protein [Zea mays]|nr:CTP synthase family protein [Zea mays]